MAKYWLRLFLLIGAVVGVIAAIGSVLPRSYDFVSEIEIAAPPEKIFPEINTLSHWKNWTHQWNPEKIAGLQVSYSGPVAGAGATQSWSEPRGEGKLWITNSKANQQVEYKVLFHNFPEMISSIELEPTDTGTRVRWSSRGKLPSGPFYGFAAPLFSNQMRFQYQQNLENLEQNLKADDS